MAQEYKCLIVDDEKPAHQVVIAHLSQMTEIISYDCAYDGMEAVSKLIENRFDIVFLDIGMPKLDGMSVLQSLAYKPAVIIVTAYQDFAFEAYQQDAVDYLLKPVSLARFIKAFQKAKHHCEALLPPPTKNLRLKIDGQYRNIDPDEIQYIQSYGNYLKLFFSDNRSLLIHDTLKSLIGQLPNTFIQSHKSFAVNSNHVLRVHHNKITLKNSKDIPLGRKYGHYLHKRLGYVF